MPESTHHYYDQLTFENRIIANKFYKFYYHCGTNTAETAKQTFHLTELEKKNLILK